jgi:hypothetical protein
MQNVIPRAPNLYLCTKRYTQNTIKNQNGVLTDIQATQEDQKNKTEK